MADTETTVASITSAALARLDARERPVLSGDALARFARIYLRHVDLVPPMPLSERDLAGIMATHIEVGATRAPEEMIVRPVLPQAARDGWAAKGAVLVMAVLDDQPFIIDTLSLTVGQRGWTLDEVIHPQIRVARDDDGHLLGLAAEGASLAESWVALVVRPPLGTAASAEIDDLVEALSNALDQLDAVGDDAELMRAKALATADLVTGPADDVARTRAMLEWLAAEHFIFLGYREYEIADGAAAFTPVKGSGLGILRGDVVDDAAFDAVPGDDSADLMVITKDSIRSRIHRAAFRDYVGVRILDEAGNPVGEHRFLGLFTETANNESVLRVPYLSGKIKQITELIGYAPDSYGGQTVRQILESYPREELYQAPASDLAPVIEEISQLTVRDEARVFLRYGRWGRFVTAIVYLPSERYTSAVQAQMADVLLKAFDGESISHRAFVGESVLARSYFTVQLRPNRPRPEIDLLALEASIDEATRTWEDQFVMLADELPSEQRGIEIGKRYRDDYTPREGLVDLARLNEASSTGEMTLLTYVPPTGSGADLRLKAYVVGSDMLLSDAMPHLTSLGVRVVDERPYEVELRGQQAMIYDFGLLLPADAGEWDAEEQTYFTDAFAASVAGRTEADELNRFVSDSHLTWRQVGLLRALSRYLQQVGIPYSQAYIARTLTSNQPLALKLLTLFKTRFDPDVFTADAEERSAAVAELTTEIMADLDAVPSLDDDRILRLMMTVIQALVRTNYYTERYWNGDDALALKLLPKRIDALPEPRPEFEIFVYSPRVEGVHLRYGKVARGGLRWSDRAEDYRTEVLGLVKAQMVKNTVIVPVGAKGGFYPRTLTPTMDRGERAAEGLGSYRVFISSLLSVTDNIVNGEIVPPDRVVRADADDYYLVVAADKGTATFSDEANAIAIERGFWLGDAFASGGSRGYDHKGMGITARGAWESVKRHFAEMGIDCQNEDFTCVGIGDMAGDVFGNGMLRSEHTRLVAAFNHMHIFLDPNPDAASSFVERKRLFELPRSTWADYDASLISEGGGVHERSAKSVTITPQVRAVLGLADDVERLTPSELISAILRAPVDLLFNGGIGTYVKGSGETNEHVGDKANDSVRVIGGEVRARAVGEGGNLGWTQRGRVEYARTGGRINTDFIDNSGGVDTSDREVNIKILLDAQVAAGRLSVDERNALLPQMADDVAHLVLRSNVDQNTTLADTLRNAAARGGHHEHLMTWLTDAGYLRREIEDLPTSDEMEARIARGEGLTNPELAVLLSYTKILLEDAILLTDLPDDPYLADRLVQYFPPLLRERFADQMPNHPLAREIITTVAVNRFVDSQGLSAAHRLTDETGASFEDVFRAQLAARNIFNAGPMEVALRNSPLSAVDKITARLDIRHLIERGTRWLLHEARGQAIDIVAVVDAFKPGVQQLLAQSQELFGDAMMSRAHLLLPVVRVAQLNNVDLTLAAKVFFGLSERIGADSMLAGASALPRTNRWEIKARAAMRDELHSVQEVAAASALAMPGGTDAEQIIDDWFAARPSAQAQVKLLHELTVGTPDLARMSVGLRALRGLLD